MTRVRKSLYLTVSGGAGKAVDGPEGNISPDRKVAGALVMGAGNPVVRKRISPSKTPTLSSVKALP